MPFTFFNDRSSYGPEMGMSIRVPISQSFWFRLNGQGGIVFLTREDPVDSGELDQGYQWSAHIEGQFNFTQALDFDFMFITGTKSFNFTGFGTRAQGIQNAKTTDKSVLSTLSGVWIL